MKQLLGL